MESPDRKGNSLVTFELSEASGGTKLRLMHTGLDSFPADVPELAMHNFEKGWNQIIHVTLKEFLENNNQ